MARTQIVSAKIQAQTRAIEPFARWQISGGLLIVAVFVVTITAWSSVAPLSSAVVASGIVGVETHRKAIQHLEGGIIGRILVREGSRVARGDVLIELRDIAARANVDRLKSQFYEALATVARLASERDGLTEIAVPDNLVAAAAQDPVARSALAAQRKIFDSRGDLQGQRLAVLDKRIERLQEERIGLRRQLQAMATQVSLNEQEVKDATALFEKQLIRKSRLTDLQRNRALLEERRSGLESSLSQAEQQIAELELRKREQQSTTLTAVAEDIRARQAKAHELSKELVAAQDQLERMLIRAPIGGSVVGLQVHSRDGVIAPGQTLMEIVPLSDTLVVDARIRPEDIEDVQQGLPAQIVLNTASRRFSQPLPGSLTTVSADRLVDKVTGRPYYAVRVAFDTSALAPEDSRLLAGMSADVFIRTSDRTPIAYLVAPLVRTINRGMRER